MESTNSKKFKQAQRLHRTRTAVTFIPQSTLGSVAKSPIGDQPGSQTQMPETPIEFTVAFDTSKHIPRPEQTPPGSPKRGTQADVEIDILLLFQFAFRVRNKQIRKFG